MKADRIWFENVKALWAKILRLFNPTKAGNGKFSAKIFLCFTAARRRSATLIYYLNLGGFGPLFILKNLSRRGNLAVWGS